MQDHDQQHNKPHEETQAVERKAHKLPSGIPIQAEGQFSVSVSEDLKVILTREAFAQLFGYVYATEMEVSCLGDVVQEGSVFKITKFYLLKQAGSPAHTEMLPEAVAELAESIHKTGETCQLRAWAHSHPGMGLFWSQTDEATCRTLVSDYLISLVVGKGFSVRCRIDLSGPIALTLDHVPVLYETAIDETLLKTCREEVKQKLSAASPLGMLFEDGYSLNSLFSQDNDRFCERCGNWHAPGKCPMDSYDWEEGLDLEALSSTTTDYWEE
jgi:proteasome lid subunit RPN8/RPN11